MAQSEPQRLRRAPASGAIASYIALSLFCWNHLFRSGFGSNLHTLQLGDAGQGVWYMGWLPFALGHGLNPLLTGYMFAPHGANLLTNTPFYVEALILSPITVTLGPLWAFNIACVLAPVVSAATMYWVLRRLGLGAGACWFGGLAYGAAPAIMQADPLGHFNLTWMFFPPLLLLALDRILLRQEGSATRYGLWLGVLVVVQFFNSPEILLDSFVLAVVAILICIAARPSEVRSHAGFALRAFGVAAVIAAAVLAYPIAVYVGGPQHVVDLGASVHPGAALTSPVWPSEKTGVGFLTAPPSTPFLKRFDAGFLGPVVILLAAGSLLLGRTRRTIGLLAGTAFVSFVLTWGSGLRTLPSASTSSWHAPAWFLGQLPLLRNIDWIRISVVTDCLVIVLAALSVDELLRVLATRRSDGRLVPATTMTVLAVLAGLAIVPMLVASGAPFGSFSSVVAPAVLSRIPQVNGEAPIAVVYPNGSLFSGTPLAWQALAGFTWRDWSGYAWHPSADRSGIGTVGAEPSVVQYLVAEASKTNPDVVLTPAQHRQIAGSVNALHITCLVVVNGHPGSPQLTRVFTQVFGRGTPEPGGTLWLVLGTAARSG